MWKRQSNYELKINVQCVDSMNENIIATTIDQNIVQIDQNNVQVQTFRNTRIVQLKKTNIKRNNQLEQTNNFRVQLIEKWKCHNDICFNESNYCYSKNRNHYKLINVHFETWINSIFDDKNEISVEHSFVLMLTHIKVTQNVVDIKFTNFLMLINKHEREQRRIEKKNDENENVVKKNENEIVDDEKKKIVVNNDMIACLIVNTQR